MHQFDNDWQLIVCLFCVCVWEWKKTALRLLFTIEMTISVELNHGCLLVWIWCYRNGMPGSHRTPRGVSSQKHESIKPLEVCSCGLTEPDCQQRRPWKLKTHWCLLYALCFYSSWACGQFMGRSEVPSEKKPDLKPATGHLAKTFKIILWRFPIKTQRISFHPSSARRFRGWFETSTV